MRFLGDDRQSGVATDGLGLRPTQFDAVVGGGIVAGGEHGTRAVQ